MLLPIEQGPFFAVPRGANSVPAVLGGLTVNENQQCLGTEGAPIEGLFAVDVYKRQGKPFSDSPRNLTSG